MNKPNLRIANSENSQSFLPTTAKSNPKILPPWLTTAPGILTPQHLRRYSIHCMPSGKSLRPSVCPSVKRAASFILGFLDSPELSQQFGYAGPHTSYTCTTGSHKKCLSPDSSLGCSDSVGQRQNSGICLPTSSAILISRHFWEPLSWSIENCS